MTEYVKINEDVETYSDDLKPGQVYPVHTRHETGVAISDSDGAPFWFGDHEFTERGASVKEPIITTLPDHIKPNKPLDKFSITLYPTGDVMGEGIDLGDFITDIGNSFSISGEALECLDEEYPEDDVVNHPSHYTGFSNGAEVIDITENLSFNRGNAVKYLARAGAKDPETEVQDLEKAAWYVAREISLLEGHTTEEGHDD